MQTPKYTKRHEDQNGYSPPSRPSSFCLTRSRVRLASALAMPSPAPSSGCSSSAAATHQALFFIPSSSAPPIFTRARFAHYVAVLFAEAILKRSYLDCWPCAMPAMPRQIEWQECVDPSQKASQSEEIIGQLWRSGKQRVGEACEETKRALRESCADSDHRHNARGIMSACSKGSPAILLPHLASKYLFNNQHRVVPMGISWLGSEGLPGKPAGSAMEETWRWCALAGVRAQR